MAEAVRKITLFDADLWDEVMDFRFKRRMNTEADATRTLVQAGLRYYKLMEDPIFVEAVAAAVDRLTQSKKMPSSSTGIDPTI